MLKRHNCAATPWMGGWAWPRTRQETRAGAGLASDVGERAGNGFGLATGAVVRLEAGSGAKGIRVRRGCVWLTGTPADGDQVLAEGQQFVFGEQWPYVMEALVASEIEMIS